MRNIYISLICIVCMMLLSSCNKSEIPTFTSLSDVSLINIVGDESEISFDLLPVTDTSFVITARLAGLATNVDRKINIVASDSTTAIEGEHFILTECTIPANKVEGECKLTLLKPEVLAEGDSLIVELEVLKSGELVPGIDTRLRYKIVAGLPNDWSNWMALYCFGSYSKVKYKFLIDLYGSPKAIDDAINSWNWGPHQFFVYKALQKYKEEHGGPLLDENDNEVTVPIYL